MIKTMTALNQSMCSTWDSAKKYNGDKKTRKGRRRSCMVDLAITWKVTGSLEVFFTTKGHSTYRDTKTVIATCRHSEANSLWLYVCYVPLW